MPNYFNLTLDTTGPSNVTITLAGGAQYATQQLINAAIATADTPTTGYQMKIWGDLDIAWAKSNGLLGAGASASTEADSTWITFATTRQLQLSAGDGNKTINCKVRDDVYNPSAQSSDSITLDTTRPEVTITGPDVSKISKQSGKSVSSFSFVADSAYTAYKVKVVASTGAAHDTGVQIPTTGGSTNMSGGAGTGVTPVECTITGADLETASSGDGAKIVKVFVQDAAGNWSA
ncbi:hypothetical protein B1748_29175 [Paenibacillus sp. MY03]|uniref:hypothetical protein n=1 Tax=Paenibacillus sp. MY03 TaxID=302980 RepID=UPI000B3D3BB1|nr:hypothetical protein [Paenibacillus sp. MY03]OUS70309.1 hypothetical protein B1748_29175 [Paenibacillus sp. MY03]